MDKKKAIASSARAARAARNVVNIPDSEIDFSDIPELTDEQLKSARRVGRPKSAHAKQLIAIRIDPRLLNRIRRLARNNRKPYQTYIHELLEAASR
jgi:predicted DNA binding CopG/RHH family protein